MAKLTVQAVRGTYDPLYSSQDPVAVHVSVTDDEGQPVNALNQGAFSLRVLEAPTFETEGGPVPLAVTIASILEPYPGFYKVTIKPGPINPSHPYAWDRGFITLGIAVKRMVIQSTGSGPLQGSTPRTDYGQTVIALEMVQPGS